MFNAKAAFLLVAAGLTFHLSVFEVFLLIVGYTAFDNLDQWLARRARRERIQQVIDYESEWKQDPDDPEWEVQGGLTRIKLPRNEQIVVTRVAEILRRIHSS
jgi:hypothetical protein